MKTIIDILNEATQKDVKKLSDSELRRLISIADVHHSKSNPDHQKRAKSAEAELRRREKTNEDKGHLIHQLTSSEHLSKIVKGHIDPVHLAKRELAARGHDSNGKWIGFDAAKEHHFPKDEKKKKPLKEDVESIDEVSNEKLGQYVKKASKDIERHTHKADFHDHSLDTAKHHDDFEWNLKKAEHHFDKSNKRKSGIAKAVDKLSKRADSPDKNYKHIATDKLKTLTHHDDITVRKAASAELLRRNKAAHVNAHIDETVQIDEISKTALGNYIKKAKDSMAGHAQDSKEHEKTADHLHSALGHDSLTKHGTAVTDHYREKEFASARKARKRGKFIDKAVDKLTK